MATAPWDALCTRAGKDSFYPNLKNAARTLVQHAKSKNHKAFEDALNTNKEGGKLAFTQYVEASMKYLFDKGGQDVQDKLSDFRVGAKLQHVDLSNFASQVSFQVPDLGMPGACWPTSKQLPCRALPPRPRTWTALSGSRCTSG